MTPRKSTISVLVLVIALTAMAGPLSAPAKAQSYSVAIDIVFQQSFEVFEDITVFGTLTVLLPPAATDTISIALLANDTGTSQVRQLTIDSSTPVGTERFFDVSHVTFAKGEFILTISSQLLAMEIYRATYPVPNYRVAVDLSTTLGDVGTPYVVETVIQLGNMTLVSTRFDIQYVLDGRPATHSQNVFLLNTERFVVGPNPLPPNPNYLEWRSTQTFTLEPGEHVLEVTVFDTHIVEGTPPSAARVLSETFTITVVDSASSRLEDLQDSLEGRLDTIDDRADALDQRAASTEATAAITNVLAWLSVVAIGLSAFSLLIHFGILRLGRLRKE